MEEMVTKLPKGFTTLLPPYPFQKEVIVYGIVHPTAGLLLDVGLGKTYCAINIARFRIQQGQVNKVLVVSPATLMFNWAREIEKYSEYSACVLHAPRNERIELIESFAEDSTYFGVINYEALFPFYNWLYKIPMDMLIFDESARYVKTFGAKRTEALMNLSPYFKYKLMLTATPIANKPMDLWSQFMILDDGETFGDSFWSFKYGCFDKIDYGYYEKYELKPSMVSRFRKKIHNTCIVKNKKECLPDLPEIIEHTIHVEMDGGFSDTYNEVRRNIISEIETIEGTTRISIQNVLTKLIRLQQLTSGFMKNDSDEVERLVWTPKLDATVEEIKTIVDAEESCVIMCRFIPSIKLIEEELRITNIPCDVMYGKTKNKDSVWKGFQQNDVPVFIAQVQSGGIGIELFKEDSNPDKMQHMIIYEYTWYMDDKTQADGRIHRIGQLSKCRYVDIIVSNTIDERLKENYIHNKSIADSIIKYGIKEAI